ncbi:MAG: hypothetical protein IKH44_09775 [Bacteroidales bacterium]|nr:hypothetical protein [Bacteroidales bacterium]
MAATFGRPRLIVGFRFPVLVSPFRSGNDRDSVCCLAVKGCGGSSSLVGKLYGRSLCHPVRLQREKRLEGLLRSVRHQACHRPALA